VIDIKEVSAGGGTIAWIDAGGALALGPRSASADPGPVCYRRGGTEPTVTDANLVLGRISPSRFLGGAMPLDPDAAAESIEQRLAGPLGLSREDAAAGVVRLAEVKMALGVQSITTERGLDPRDYALVAYGGGGPLHASAIARELGIPRVVIPPAPSTFSAWGMLSSDLRHDLVRTVLETLTSTDAAWAARQFDDMSREMAARLPQVGEPVARHAVDMRYLGQIHTVTVELADTEMWDQLRAQFDAAHKRAYGYAAADVPVELINLRLTLVVPIERSRLPVLARASGDPAFETRRIYSPGARAYTTYRVVQRDDLRAGHVIEGPAAVEEAGTTTLVEPGDVLTVEEHGCFLIRLS